MNGNEGTSQENMPRPSRDEQVGVLIREYIRLSEKIDRMEKKLEEQQRETGKKAQAVEQQHVDLLVNAILADVRERKKQEAIQPSAAAKPQKPAGSEKPAEEKELEINPALENTRKSRRIPPNPPIPLPEAALQAKEQTGPPRTEAASPKHAAPKDRRKIAEEETVKAYPSRVARNMESRSKIKNHSKEEQGQPQKSRAWKITGEVIFYGLLVLLVLGAVFIRTASDGAPRSLAGYSGMIVLTESMQSEIPKGSLVIAKQVNVNTLQIGDDITYMANQTTSVTYRIVGIMENYQGTGERAFETQGIMNAQPDKLPVPAANVVGKVVYHSEILGQIAGFIQSYWPILLFVLVVGIVLLHVLGRIFRSGPEAKKETSI